MKIKELLKSVLALLMFILVFIIIPGIAGALEFQMGP